ncbi:MAG: phosphatidylglycerophosphatase A [bacterium]|nr:phosphatidylglycerophosphatase A [bacterium]
MRERVVKFIATGSYTGYSPVLSGTIGSLVGAGIYLWISYFSTLIYILFLLLFLIFGIWICKAAEGIFQESDSPYIVIDEICGYLVAMFLLPKTPFFIILSFIIFRILDVSKLYPINIIQKVKNGFGIMLDDFTCGIVTNIILQIIRCIYVQ